MIRHRCRSIGLAACVLAVTTTLAHAEVKLNALFTSHMVLQRDRANPVWGTAKPGATVEVKLDGKPVDTAKAGDDGKFTVTLPKLEADGAKPHTVELSDPEASLTLSDVVIGDVWVCSGQSNMQWTLANARDAAQEIAAANHPNIRLFTVPNVPKAQPVDDIAAQPWTPVTPQSARSFSAVAYFFGRKLNGELNVPIGLIDTSWGGTPAEAWTPAERLEDLAKSRLPQIAKMMERRALATSPDGRQKLAQAREQYKAEYVEWLKRIGRYDSGPTEAAAGWAKPDFDDSGWASVTPPHDWVAAGGANGGAWYRKTIDVPAELAGKPMQLQLGSIDDSDTTWFNGQEVGKTPVETPAGWMMPRVYQVPAEAVKAGKNTIAIRAWDTGGGAGLSGPAAAMKATIGDTNLPLNGAWKWKQETSYKAGDPSVPPPEDPSAAMQIDNQNAPAALYNGMIHPLGKFGITGAIWYQGETNAPRYQEYERLLSTMIGAWRDQFGQGDFPFYIVGLANYMKPTDDPNANENWAGLREAQRQVAKRVPNAGMSVTIDIGETNDIHPKNKQDVGDRLARIALHDAYGKEEVVSRGPTLRDAYFGDGKVTLTFDNVAGGLEAKGDGGKLASFAIAGEDGQFVWADASIDGDKVVLTAPQVGKPTQAKYAYANNPKATLYNAAGLPAEPFIVKK